MKRKQNKERKLGKRAQNETKKQQYIVIRKENERHDWKQNGWQRPEIWTIQYVEKPTLLCVELLEMFYELLYRVNNYWLSINVFLQIERSWLHLIKLVLYIWLEETKR